MTAASELNELEEVLEQLKDFQLETSEETFLSIGGRGYYENPTSDLLQFFLQPNKEHGFGSLFLECLIDATAWENDAAPQDLDLSTFTVKREVRTGDDKRIDLLLTGSGWMMSIENKIWHHEVNPFESYNQLAEQRKREGDQVLKLILAPNNSNNPDGWSRATYKNFLTEVSQRLQELTSHGNEKWLYFAKDFVLHLQQDLYTKKMNPEEIAFVEQHQQELTKAGELQQRYRQHLLTHLPNLVEKTNPSDESWAKDQGWAIRVYDHRWKGADLAWFHKDGLHLSVYLDQHSEEELKHALETFGSYGMRHWTEGRTPCQCWTTEGTGTVFATVVEAETRFKRLAKDLSRILSS